MKRFINLIALSLIAVLLLSACSTDKPVGKGEIKLYFADKEKTTLVSETAYINEASFGNTQTLVTEVMEKLFDGPVNPENSAVIPEGVSLRGASESKNEPGLVNIDIGGEFYLNTTEPNNASNELLARYSIVMTLCQFENIKKVKIYVNGEDLRSMGGKGEIVEPLGSSSVLTDSPSSSETRTEKFITLYFTDKEGKMLHPETRKATMTDNSIEKTVITELIKGPVSPNLERTFPKDTEFISVETTEEVCFVNFTGAFMSEFKNNYQSQELAVYSVVNSLTRIAGIEKVQILIDGKKPESDGNQLFSAPLERNAALAE